MVTFIRPDIKEKRSLKCSWILLLISMALMFITGCNSEHEYNEEKLLCVDVPSGFEVLGISEKECSIVDSEGENVGGVVITDLSVEDIKDSDSIAFAQYMNKTHEGCEYFSWLGNDAANPAKYVNQYVDIPESSEDKEFYRILFERDSRIYDMWFDCDMIDQTNIEVFVATIVEQ